MRTNDLYDAASIAARCTVEDVLAVAARERIIWEGQRTTHCLFPVAEVGRLLVRLGQWLQTMAQQPTYREETV